MLHVINFADANYARQQELNTSSAYERGKADKVISYHEEAIEPLRERYPDHFAIKRGFGLWFWKPYLIMKAMDEINEGDYLFYCDSGAVFIDDIHQLLPDLEASGRSMLVFEQPLRACCFTKGETYHLLGCNDFSGNQLLGGYILLRKCEESYKYMQEWHEAMTDIRVLSGEKFLPEIKDHRDFVSHREDQSVLTLLCKKWGIEGHRDPSDFGEFPWQYAMAGGFHRKKYPNSHYPTLLLCVRKEDPNVYEQRYRKAVADKHSDLYYDIKTWWRILPNKIKHTGKVILLSMGLECLHKKIKSK